MIRKVLLSMLWSEIFVYACTALPGATATPECFKLASSDVKKLSKKPESQHSVCYNGTTPWSFLNDCVCKSCSNCNVNGLHNSEQSLNILYHIYILLCHHSPSNEKKHLKSQVFGVLPLKSIHWGGGERRSTHHTSCLATLRKKGVCLMHKYILAVSCRTMASMISLRLQ